MMDDEQIMVKLDSLDENIKNNISSYHLPRKANNIWLSRKMHLLEQSMQGKERTKI
jgi:hypothetical protein